MASKAKLYKACLDVPLHHCSGHHTCGVLLSSCATWQAWVYHSITAVGTILVGVVLSSCVTSHAAEEERLLQDITVTHALLVWLS